MAALRGLRRWLQRAKGASAVNQGLLVALIAAAIIGAVIATGDGIERGFERVSCAVQSALGTPATDCGAAAPQPVPTDPANPPEDADPQDIALNALRFADRVVEPGTYTVTETVRVIGFSGTLAVGIASPEAAEGADAQVSVAGEPFAETASISEGQTLRLRLRAADSFSTARTARVTVGPQQVPAWTVTVRDRDETPEPALIVRDTPWTLPAGEGVQVLVPPADTALDGPRRTQALFPTYAGGQPVAGSRVPQLVLDGFDGPLPVRLTLSGAPAGTRALAQTNGGDWAEPDATGLALELMPRDSLALAVEVPANSFGASFSVGIEVGTATASWPVTVRGQNTVPQPLAFDPVTGLAPGNGSQAVLSNAALMRGLEQPGTVALAEPPVPGSAVRVCGSAGCAEDAGDSAGGWSPWGSSATVQEGWTVQLRMTVPTVSDVTAVIATVAGDGTSLGEWSVSTATDGPTPLTIPPSEDVEPGVAAVSEQLRIQGSGGPVTVSVPAGASISSGRQTGLTTLQVKENQVFTLRTIAPAASGDAAARTVEIPVTVSGPDGSGVTRVWSDDWTPRPVWRVVTRPADSAPDSFAFAPRSGIDPDAPADSQPVAVDGFDGSLPVSVAGPPGTRLIVTGGGQAQEILPGASASIAAGSLLVVQLRGAPIFDTATTATVTLGSGDSAASADFTVTTRSQRAAPDSLDFPPVSGIAPDAWAVSEPLALAGFDSAIAIAVTGEGDPQFRTGDADSWGEADWRSGIALVDPSVALQLRARADTAFGAERTIFIAGGIAAEDDLSLVEVLREGTWRIGTVSNTLEFPAIGDAVPGSIVPSAATMLSAVGGTVTATLSGEASAVLFVNGVASGRSASVTDDDVVRLELTAPAEFGAATQAVLSLDGRQAEWSVTTRARRATPDPLPVLPALTGLVPGTPRRTGAAVVLGGYDGPLTVAASGPLAPLVVVNGGLPAATATLQPGDSVALEVDPPADWSRTEKPVLTLGGVAVQMTVSTRARSFCPQGVAFPTVPNTAPGTQVLSAQVELGAADGTLPVALRSTLPAQLNIDDAGWAATGAVEEGSLLQLRTTFPTDSAASNEIAVLFGPNGECTVTWVIGPAPGTPAAPATLSFTGRTGVDPGAALRLDGTPSPLVLAQPVALSVSEGALISVNDAAGTAAATLVNGDRVALLVTAPDSFSAEKTVAVRFGSASSVVRVTTRALRTAVSGLTFAPANALEPGTRLCHDPVTLTGFEVPLAASVTGPAGALPTLAIAAGAAGSGGPVAAGQSLQLCATASTTLGESRDVTVTVGTTTARWTLKVRPADTVPDALGLSTLYGAPVNDRISTELNIAGFDGSLTATASDAGTGGHNSQPRLSKNGATEVAGPVSVVAGDRLVLSMLTGPYIDRWASAQVTLGPQTGLWSAYTGFDNEPESFDLIDPATPAEPGATLTSNTVTLSGFHNALPITLSGDSAARLIVGGVDIGTSGQATAGQSLRVTTVAPASYGTVRTVTVTVGPHVSDTWTFATRGADNTPNSIAFPAHTGVDPAAVRTSASRTLSSFDGRQAVSITALPAGDPVEFSLDGGKSWRTSGSATAGTAVLLRMTASATYSTDRVATLRVGAASFPWTVTTRAVDLSPASMGLSVEYGGALAATVSTPVVLSSFDGTMEARAVNADPAGFDPQPRLSLNGGPETPGPLTVRAGDSLMLIHNTAPYIDTWSKSLVTLSAGGSVRRSDSWELYTGPDNIPNSFDFVISGTISPNTTYTSNEVTVGGFSGTLTANASGPSGVRWVLNGTDAGLTAVTVKSGDRLRLRQTTGTDYNVTLTTTISIGPYVTDDVVLRVRGEDITPNNFAPAAVTDAVPSTTVTSATFNVTSFEGPLWMSVSGRVNNDVFPTDVIVAEMSIDGQQTWTTGALVNPGTSVTVRARSHKTWGQAMRTSIVLGTRTYDWVVTNRTQLLDSRLKYTIGTTNSTNRQYWPTVQEVDRGAPQWTVAGTVYNFDGPLTATFTSRPGNAEMRVNGGAWVTSASLRVNDRLELRMTPATYGSNNAVRVQLGNTALRWDVYARLPAPVWGADPQTAFTTGRAVSGTGLAATAADGFAVTYTRSGSMPTGMSFNTTTGAISGTPSAAGSWTVTFTPRVSSPNTSYWNTQTGEARTFTFVVKAPPTWNETSDYLPVATVGTPYSYNLKATVADTPASFSVASGNLPAGLTLSAGGTISGTASGAGGQTNVNFRVTDSAGRSSDRTLTMMIGAADGGSAVFEGCLGGSATCSACTGNTLTRGFTAAQINPSQAGRTIRRVRATLITTGDLNSPGETISLGASGALYGGSQCGTHTQINDQWINVNSATLNLTIASAVAGTTYRLFIFETEFQ